MDPGVAGQGMAKVRLSKSLSEGEKAATASRKEKIKEALAVLRIPYDSDTIPSIAVMGSGGGLRATIALCGTLVELKEQNILDCIMYLVGVSGSAWCMSSFYKTENWSERLMELEKQQRKTLSQGQWDFEATVKALANAASDENYSLTDFWAYFIVHKMLKEFKVLVTIIPSYKLHSANRILLLVLLYSQVKKTPQLDETTLSEHRRSSESGKNPYPVYAAVNNSTYEEDLAGTWFEFTPHEAGIPDLDAHTDTKYFGSAFENGQMVEEKEEKNICYLQGLWGSTFGSKQDMTIILRDALRELRDRMRIYSGLFHLLHKLHNVLIKTVTCLHQWKWGTTNNLLYNCCEAGDFNFSNERTIPLIDAGKAINIAYPLILHPKRNVKLILSFDFSSGDPFWTLERAAEHCKKHGIRFPETGEIQSLDKKNPSTCYIFRGENAPTIMHFPLFNKDNCQDKIPEYIRQFDTFKMKYSSEDIEKLLIAAKKNVVNAQEKIWEEIACAVAPSS